MERSAAVRMQDALAPAQSAAEGVLHQLARLVSSQPDLQFPISNDRAQTWLINYLPGRGACPPATVTQRQARKAQAAPPFQSVCPQSSMLPGCCL